MGYSKYQAKSHQVLGYRICFVQIGPNVLITKWFPEWLLKQLLKMVTKMVTKMVYKMITRIVTKMQN